MKKNYIINCIIFFIFCFLFRASYANSNFSENSVGAVMEEDVRNLVKSCFQNQGVEYEKAFLPGEIQGAMYTSSLNVNSGKYSAIGVNLPSIAKQVYDSSSPKTSAMLDLATPKIQIDMADMAPAISNDNLIYSLNCTSILKMGIDQGFSFPFFGGGGGVTAGLKNAFNAQASNSRKTNLLIMYGVFESPLAFAFSRSAPKIEKISAATSIWKFYIDNPPKSESQNLYYLKNFRGWFISDTRNDELAAAMGWNAEFSTNLLLFSAKLNTDAKLKINNSLISSRFKIFFNKSFLGDFPDLTTTKFPSISDLESNINSATEVLPLVTEIPYIKNSSMAVTLSLPGMPADFCETAGWEIQGTADFTVGVTRSALLDKDCRITSNITPLKEGLTSLLIGATANKSPIVIDAKTKHYIKISNNVLVKQINSPNFFFVDQPKVFTILGVNPLGYKINALISYTAIGTMKNITSNNFSVECFGQQSIAMGQHSFNYREADRMVELAVVIYGDFPINQSCRIGIDLNADYVASPSSSYNIQTDSGKLKSPPFYINNSIQN